MSGRRSRSVPRRPHRDRASPGPGWVVWVPAIVALLCYLPALRNGFALDDVVIIADDAAHRITCPLSALPWVVRTGTMWGTCTVPSRRCRSVSSGPLDVGHRCCSTPSTSLWHAAVSALVATAGTALVARRRPLSAPDCGSPFIRSTPRRSPTSSAGRSWSAPPPSSACALLGTARRRARTTPRQAGPPRTVSPLWLAFALAACAMASKETGVVAPAVAWAAAVTPLPGRPRAPSPPAGLWPLRLASAAAAGVGCLLGRPLADPGHAGRRRSPLRVRARQRLARAAAGAGDGPARAVAHARPPAAAAGLFSARCAHPPPRSSALVLLGRCHRGGGDRPSLWRHVRRPAPWSFVAAFGALHVRAGLQPPRPQRRRGRRSHALLAERGDRRSPPARALMAAWAARNGSLWVPLGVVAAVGLWFTDRFPWRVEGLAGGVRGDSRAVARPAIWVTSRSPSCVIAAGDAARCGAASTRSPSDSRRITRAVLYMAAANAIRLRDTTRALGSPHPRGRAPSRRRADAHGAGGPGAAARRHGIARATQLRDGLAIDSAQRRSGARSCSKIGG